MSKKKQQQQQQQKTLYYIFRTGECIDRFIDERKSFLITLKHLFAPEWSEPSVAWFDGRITWLKLSQYYYSKGKIII